MYKVLWHFGQIPRNYKVTEFWIQLKWRHTRECTEHFIPGFLCIFFFTNLWSCEVLNVKPYLNVRDTIHTNEQTKHANCGLHGLRGFMWFCFKTKKDHFKQKLLLWPQVPFKGFNLCRPSVPSLYYSLMPPVSTTFLQLKIRKIIFWRPPIIKIAFSWLWWRRWNWMQFVCNCIIKSPEFSDIFKNYK